MFEKKHLGRGIKLIFVVAPKLEEREFELVKRTLKMEPLFKNYFGYIDVTMLGDTGAWSKIKLYCSNTLFTTTVSNAEKVYTELFYMLFGRIAYLCQVGLKKDLDIVEFDLLYRIMPKEKSGDFIPLLSLRTIGAFIFWRKINAMNMQDLTKKVTTEMDKERLREIMGSASDSRPIVEKHRDFILNLSTELGLLKPLTKKDLVNDPTLVKAIEDTAKSDKAYDGTEAYKGFMPLSDDELALINDFILGETK